MAAFRNIRRILLNIINNRQFILSKRCAKFLLFGAAGYGSILSLRSVISWRFNPIQTIYAAKDEHGGAATKKHYREMRFRQFASVEYDGNLYMTPQDFLESLIEEAPRARIGRTQLSQKDVDQLLRSTPSVSRGSDKFFRKLQDKGIISYTEYLFLLCVLTKPLSGFQIAFNMFDTDGNQIVDKTEFLVLEKVFSNGSKQEEDGQETENKRQHFQEVHQEIHDTTLLVHFFGRNGKNVLKYKDFHRFIENLQSEVIELEFLEFSKGFSTISEVSFAKILLRYTNLDRNDVEECLERVRNRVSNEKGITFDEFKKFCQFLNNLDDFTIAMKMYTFAEQSVSKEEFQRAVLVCTGFSLGSHIVSTLFNIFDRDQDGNLSHKEFISIMKDRLHRGTRTHVMHNLSILDAFKSCVKKEMK